MKSSERIILPFYKITRKPTMRFYIYHFVFSTPSDFYYYNLQEFKTLEKNE